MSARSRRMVLKETISAIKTDELGLSNSKAGDQAVGPSDNQTIEIEVDVREHEIGEIAQSSSQQIHNVNLSTTQEPCCDECTRLTKQCRKYRNLWLEAKSKLRIAKAKAAAAKSKCTCVLWYLLKSFFPKPKVGDFSNKYVLITGCDSGFGKTTAIRLDQMGFHVISCCLTREGKENFQTVCSDRLVSVLMDVTDSKQIRDVFVQVKNIVADKGVWAVINNAGYMTIGPLEWFTMKDYKKMADVNLWGLIEVTKTFLPLVKKAEGRIVNFASIAGLVSYAGFAPYCVTKFGVEAFSDALRREMVEWKVKVSILEPQGFKTPLWTEISGKKLTSLWDGLTDEIKKEYGEDYFAKRRGTTSLNKRCLEFYAR
ncbi:hypothetical protein QZH41_005376 [Actinostola sp. cb2023]|nr:hypothetical protein QZH41_005376 [Actinostola sp. cb2023]